MSADIQKTIDALARGCFPGLPEHIDRLIAELQDITKHAQSWNEPVKLAYPFTLYDVAINAAYIASVVAVMDREMWYVISKSLSKLAHEIALHDVQTKHFPTLTTACDFFNRAFAHCGKKFDSKVRATMPRVFEPLIADRPNWRDEDILQNVACWACYACQIPINDWWYKINTSEDGHTTFWHFERIYDMATGHHRHAIEGCEDLKAFIEPFCVKYLLEDCSRIHIDMTFAELYSFRNSILRFRLLDPKCDEQLHKIDVILTRKMDMTAGEIMRLSCELDARMSISMQTPFEFPFRECYWNSFKLGLDDRWTQNIILAPAVERYPKWHVVYDCDKKQVHVYGDECYKILGTITPDPIIQIGLDLHTLRDCCPYSWACKLSARDKMVSAMARTSLATLTQTPQWSEFIHQVQKLIQE
jgi:hypothetical protein